MLRRETGLGFVSMAGGVIVDDFDNDGLLDIVTSSYNVCEHLKYLPQQRRRHFHRPLGEGRVHGPTRTG